MSNFAATSSPLSCWISPTDKASSQNYRCIFERQLCICGCFCGISYLQRLEILEVRNGSLVGPSTVLRAQLYKMASRNTNTCWESQPGCPISRVRWEVGLWECLTYFALGALRSFR